MPRVGVRLWQRQAQNPVKPANPKRPRDTSGSRNWHLHRSKHASTGKYKSKCITETEAFRAMIGANVILITTYYSELMHCTEKRLNLVQISLPLYATCMKSIRVKLLWVNLHVRTMSSPLLWFPGSLYLGVNCWPKVKLRHSNNILASEKSCLYLISDLCLSKSQTY